MPSSNTKVKKAKVNIVNAISELCFDALDNAVIDVYNETYEIFRYCIDQFYLYETKSYYRHKTGRGTGEGENLYQASDFRLVKGGNGHIAGAYLGWHSGNMSPYKPWKDKKGKYHTVSTDYVLGLVMNGIRGLDDDYVDHGYASYDNHWSISNFTTARNLFGDLKGTPNQIFDKIEANIVDVTVDQFKKHLDFKLKQYTKNR